MVERSGVPVEEILECRSGEEALEILARVPVDVMFTDVRMPKMDGLTLLRRIQQGGLPYPPPETVVISGYDDFNYAVESMRCGAREYILKPIKRERVFETLQKLEGLLEAKKQTAHNRERLEQLEQIGLRHLRGIMANPAISGAELENVRNALGDLFAFGEYVVLCSNREAGPVPVEVSFRLEPAGAFLLLVVPAAELENLAEHKPIGLYRGRSHPQKDLGDFHTACEQAIESRKYAFFTGCHDMMAGDFLFGEQPFLPQSTPSQLARRIGSKDYAGLIHVLNSLFTQAARGMLHPSVFEDFLLHFLDCAEEEFARRSFPTISR
jgi:CheY-like chemotaxis protein